jgi:hypothetical protein
MLRNPFDNRESRQKIIGYAMVGAIIAAPFLGLLYAVWIGALVMALALLATSFLAFDMVITFPEEQRSRIRRLAKINLLLAGACLIAAIVSF